MQLFWLSDMPDKNPNAVALGRLGGAAATPRQAEASKRNGRRGGRPKKVPVAENGTGQPQATVQTTRGHH